MVNGACKIFESFTVDELIALAEIKKKDAEGAYDDPDDRDEVP